MLVRGVGTDAKSLSGLTRGVRYYWQIRAKNAAGFTYANGGPTSWRHFTVK